MKQLHPTKLWAVEVPEDSNTYTINLMLSKIEDKTYKTAGIATKDEIYFDVEPYVERITVEHYRNYLDNSFYLDRSCTSKDESFRSLLNANYLYFENPFPKPKPMTIYTDDDIVFDWDQLIVKEYQEMEQKVIKGKLLILEEI